MSNHRQISNDAAPPGHRGKSFLVGTICLALAAAVTLLNVGMMLTEPVVQASVSDHTDRNARLVREFYDAVNDAIRTGDAGALNTIVAPDLVWCLSCPDQLSTRDGLKHHLESLHQTAQGTHLDVESVIADSSGNVTARLRVSGHPLMGEPIPWGPVDLLRIEGGLIVERHVGDSAIPLIEPRFRTRFDYLPPAASGVLMAKLHFGVGSGLEELLSPGPTMLVVEAGTIAVRIDGGGRIVRTGGAEFPMDNNVTTLQEGDAAIVPPGVRHAFLQVGVEPAVALGVTLFVIDQGIDARSPQAPVIAPFASVESDVEPAKTNPTLQILVNGTTDGWPSGPVQIAVGRAILGHDARVVPAPNESMVLAVESGTLSVTRDEDRTAVVKAGVALPAGTVRELGNAGDGLVYLHLLTVAPAM